MIALITHGGMNSLTEIANRGKPYIAIPLFGDHTRNTNAFGRLKFGIRIDVVEINEGKLKSAIDTIIKDQKYAISLMLILECILQYSASKGSYNNRVKKSHLLKDISGFIIIYRNETSSFMPLLILYANYVENNHF